MVKKERSSLINYIYSLNNIWKILLLFVILVLIVFIAFFFLGKFNDEQEDPCIEISKLAKQDAQANVLEECRKFYGKSCANNNDCGAFPCYNNKCLVRPCDSDSECPGLCGLHITPVPGFCTTIDVE